MSKTDGSQRTYHYIYKITRVDGSGRYYIGMHSSDKPNDRYYGSGTVISSSIKKYGRKNHMKEVLEYYSSRGEAKDREVQLVNRDLLNDPLCMNIAYGGQGFDGSEVRDWWQDPKYREKVLKKQAEYWADSENRKAQSLLKKEQYKDPEVLKNVSEASKITWASKERRADRSKQKTEHWQDLAYRSKTIEAQNTGKATSEFSEAQRQAKLGSKNPNFGMMWIHNPAMKQSMRINKSDPIPSGWSLGRKMYNQST